METPFWLQMLGLFLGSLSCSWFLTPKVGAWAERRGKVAMPRDDRWHRTPTPLMGGMAIVAAFYATVGVAIAAGWFPREQWTRLMPLLGCSAAMFFLGLWDDFRNMSPQVKLLGQIILASLLVMFGYKIHWFVSKTANTFLSILWIVALTNAFNLLDNMDGLSAGVAVIAALFLYVFELLSHGASHPTNPMLLLPVFMGAVGGFLIHNFHPASIFMGDCGSLFLGFFLTGVSTQNDLSRHGHLFSIMAVPLFIFCLPLLDMALVSVTRVLFKRSPAQGGRDHTSHRLVAIGLTERQAVLVLYGFSFVGGLIALISLRDMMAFFSVAVVFLLVSALVLIHLANVRVYPSTEKSLLETNSTLTVLWIQFTYKKRIFEILLDVFFISFCYWLAYYLRYEEWAYIMAFSQFLNSLPIVLVCCLIAYFGCGIYNAMWRYTASSELMIHLGAATVGVLLSIVALVFIYEFHGFSRSVFVIFWMLLFMSLAGTRFSFRVLSDYFENLSSKSGRPVLIYGAGRRGGIILRELKENKEWGLCPIGFIDDDERKLHRRIFGCKVLGTRKNLPELVSKYGVSEVLVASNDVSDESLKDAEKICAALSVHLRKVEFHIHSQTR